MPGSQPFAFGKSPRGDAGSEMESDRAGHGARRDVVRPAESRQEIVERVIVRQVDHRHSVGAGS